MQVLRKPHKAAPVALTDEKRRLLALRLKQKAAAKPSNPWLAGAEDVQVGKPVLLCLPWAGAGTTTYRQWNELSDAFAAALVSLGVRPRDRVALVLPNIPQFFIAELGAWTMIASTLLNLDATICRS